MARAHFVKKAQKDNPVVKAGESYWWWKFRYGGKRFSKERPRPSQLTGSGFLTQVYEIQEEIEDTKPESREDLRGLAEDWASRLRDIAGEQKESRENMPEALQDGPTGELLQERASSVEEMADELDNVDFEAEPGEDETEADLLEAARDECISAADYQGE